MKDKYKKLRLLLGQHATAERAVETWRRKLTNQFEQWRGQRTIKAQIEQHEAAMKAIEVKISEEMAKLVGAAPRKKGGILILEAVE